MRYKVHCLNRVGLLIVRPDLVVTLGASVVVGIERLVVVSVGVGGVVV